MLGQLSKLQPMKQADNTGGVKKRTLKLLFLFALLILTMYDRLGTIQQGFFFPVNHISTGQPKVPLTQELTLRKQHCFLEILYFYGNSFIHSQKKKTFIGFNSP